MFYSIIPMFSLFGNNCYFSDKFFVSLNKFLVKFLDKTTISLSIEKFLQFPIVFLGRIMYNLIYFFIRVFPVQRTCCIRIFLFRLPVSPQYIE